MRMRLVLFVAVLTATQALARIPAEIEADPDKVYDYLKQLEKSGDLFDYTGDLADLEELDPRVVDEVKRRLREDEERAEQEYNDRLQREIAAEEAAATQAADQWLQNAANQMTVAYQQLPPDTEATGRAAAGRSLVESEAYYREEIDRLGREFAANGEALRAAESRIGTLTANIQSHEASQGIWEKLDFWHEDPRLNYLQAELQRANASLPGLRSTLITSREDLEAAVQGALRDRTRLTLDGIKADPVLAAAEYERRAQELLALHQELAVSRLQFVAGQGTFDKVLKEIDDKIAALDASGDEGAAGVWRETRGNVQTVYDDWLAGVQTSLAGKGREITAAQSGNARDGLGPTNDVELIQHLGSCGVDAGSVFQVARDPQTGRLPESVEQRVVSAAQSAEDLARGVFFRRSLTYDWGDFAFDSLDAFYSTETLTGAPRAAWRFGKGVGKAIGTAVYELGVFAVELGDTVLEADQYYLNAFLSNAPLVSRLGLEINWFGQENIDAAASFIDWASEDYNRKVYEATQQALSGKQRQLEMQAGAGREGALQAIEDVGFATGTAATLFVGPEELLLRGAMRGLSTGTRVASTGTDLTQAGARAADVAEDAASAGRVVGSPGEVQVPAGVAEAVTPVNPGRPAAGTGGVPGEIAEAATPINPGRPVTGGGPAAGSSGLTADVVEAGGLTSLVRVNLSDGRSLVLQNPIGQGASATVYAAPQGFDNLVIRTVKGEGARLEAVADEALAGLDPQAVLAPRVLQNYPVTTPGLEGGMVSVMQRVPADWMKITKEAISANGGNLTGGMRDALRAGLDAVASKGFVVADLKLDNFTFRPLGPPGSDQWVWVPIDRNMFIKFKTPESAQAFHQAILAPPAEYLQGNWLLNVERFLNDLARFDADVDFAGMKELTGIDYSGIAPGGANPFSFNPYLAKEAPEIRSLYASPAPVATTPAPATAPAGAATGGTGLAGEWPGGGVQWIDWVAEFNGGRAPPWLPKGRAPRFLRGQGVRELPGFLGIAPVPYRGPMTGGAGPANGLNLCRPESLPAPGTAATGEGLILHVPTEWIRDAGKAFGSVEARNELLPFTTGRFLIGECGEGDCADATGVIALHYPPSAGPQVMGVVNGLGLGWSGPDNLRMKQLPPDDPYLRSRGSWGQPYDDQWALARIGLDAAGLESALARIADGASPVVVAVIDTGVAWNHRDLGIERLWINRDEIPANRIDDDRNGYVDDVAGWNFVHRNNLPWDLDGHGTLVAGILGASAGNGHGTAGVNPHAQIMALKALDEQGNARASYLAEAIVYAVDNGARIINLSVGGRAATPTERLALDHARRRGVLVVAAAGNEGMALVDYAPAGLEGVLTVAATDPADQRLSSSNYGPAVALAAPGKDILGPRAIGTDPMANTGIEDYVRGANVVGRDRGYFRATGTSFAAPLVAGAASLLLAVNPALSAAEVERMLLQSAVDIGEPGFDPLSGYGRLDVRAALDADPRQFVEARIDAARVAQRDGVTVVEILGTADADRFAEARIELGVGDAPTEWRSAAATIPAPVRGAVLGMVDPAALAGSDRWTVRLRVRNSGGGEREARFLLKLR